MKLILFSIFLCTYLAQAVAAQQPAPVQPSATTADGRNVDSMAIWIAPRKADSLVLVTEKAGGQVMIFKANREATFIKRFGEMKRPNAIVVVQKIKMAGRKQDLAFVTERDANKVSVYSIPTFEKVGEFAADVSQPMGISVYRHKKDLLAFVVAKRATGDDKIIRFRIAEENGKIIGVRETQFGKELTPNQETVFVDAERKLVFAADETAQNIKVYDLDGNLKRTFGDGIFQAQVEGIALAECGKRRFLIAADQLDVTEFEIFDLQNFNHLGTTITTANRTDGITLTQTKLPDFPRGLFVAQSDPNGTGGLHAEFFDLKRFLGNAGLVCR